MGLTVRKLLETYFQKLDLQEALDRIDVSASGNNDELIDRILEEWEDHRKNKYDLFEILERPTLLRICKAYGLGNKGNEEDLIKKIKKSHLLDDDFVKPVINNPPSGNDATIKKKPRRILGHNISDRGLTAIIAGGTIGLLILATVPLWLPFLQCGVEDQGLTYINCPLGFHISRLNPDWSFQDITSISDQYHISYNATLLGGIMVSSPINTKVNVLVFDVKEPIFSDLSIFAQGSMNNLSTGLHIKSQEVVNYIDKNSVLFQVSGYDDNGWNVIFKEKVERHIDKVYVIQSVAKSYKDPITSESFQDLQKAYDSFGYQK